MTIHRHPHAFCFVAAPHAALEAAVLLGDGQSELGAHSSQEQLLQLLAEDLARDDIDEDVEGVLRRAVLFDGGQHELVRHHALILRVFRVY